VRLRSLELGLAAIFGLSVALSGCSGPCRALAETVCSCEPNDVEQQACLVRIDAVSDRPVSPAEEDRCDQLLESCTCDALAVDNFAACGLTKNAP
jgi:phage-related protein